MLEEVAVLAISKAKDTCGTIYIIVDDRVGTFLFNINKCDVTAPWCCGNPLTEHDMILDSYPKIYCN